VTEVYKSLNNVNPAIMQNIFTVKQSTTTSVLVQL